MSESSDIADDGSFAFDNQELVRAAAHIKELVLQQSVDYGELVTYFVRRSPQQIDQLNRAYGAKFLVTLYGVMEQVPKVPDLLVWLSMPRPVLLATLVRRSVYGLGTDDDLLVSVASCFLPQEAQGLRESYQMLYHQNVYRAVRLDTSGAYRKLLLAIFKGVRESEDTPLNPEALQKDAALLRSLGYGSSDDKEALVDIFGRRSRNHIAALMVLYQQIDGQSIFQLIQKATRGDFRRLVTAVVRSCQLAYGEMGIIPVGSLCDAIHESTVGAGQNTRWLSAVVALASPWWPFMEQAYRGFIGDSLRDVVETETTGDLRLVMMAEFGFS